MAPAYEYQWKVTIEFWNEVIAHCKKCGIEHIAIEEFDGLVCYGSFLLFLNSKLHYLYAVFVLLPVELLVMFIFNQ